MKMLALILCCVCLSPINDETARVKLKDGTTVRGVLSPDKKKIAFAHYDGNDREIHIADRDGKNAKQITRNRFLDYAPAWTPDGKRIAFCSTRTGSYQVFEMAIDGSGTQQLTKAVHGARHPKYSKQGWLAYQVMYPRKGKSQPADLVIKKGDDQREVVKNVDIMGSAWSPNGKTICFGTVNTLNFFDVETKKLIPVDVYKKDKRLYAHGAYEITWSPDNKKVACRISFLGGRTEGTMIYGDSQLFLIDPEGTFEAIEASDIKQRKEAWIKSAFGKTDSN